MQLVSFNSKIVQRFRTRKLFVVYSLELVLIEAYRLNTCQNEAGNIRQNSLHFTIV